MSDLRFVAAVGHPFSFPSDVRLLWEELKAGGLHELVVVCAVAEGVRVVDVLDRNRTKSATRARARVAFALSSPPYKKGPSEVGRLLGRDHTTGRYLIRMGEELPSPILLGAALAAASVRERQLRILRHLGFKGRLPAELTMGDFLLEVESRLYIDPSRPEPALGPVPDLPDLEAP